MGEEAGGRYDFDFLGGGGDEYEGRMAEWEAGLPGCDELTPLSQPLVPPGLAAAFRIPPEPGRTLLDVHRASSATVSRLRSNSSSPSGPNGGVSFPSFPGRGAGSAAASKDTATGNTNNSAESAGDKSAAAKRARLVWTPQLHKRFVDVVAHLGIKAAVPKSIMQLMNVEGLTRENVASHLQKYRQYVGRMHGVSANDRPSQSDDNIFASAPVPHSLLREPPQAPAPMPPAVYHHPAPMTMGGMTGGYYQHQQQHSGHAVYNGYGGGHGHGMSSWAEQIVRHYVEHHVPHAPSVAATLLRTHFHDCFVRGCDGSVLLNGTNGGEAEKDAAPNLTLRGFAFLDRVKALVEQECPGVVSCADVLALAARDAIGAIGGPFWRVPTGRRDGRVSLKQEALDQVPAPTMNFTDLLTSFRSKGLELPDLVWLSGAHTIGIAHCDSFSERLYNFTGRGGPGDADPSLNPVYAANLRRTKCATPTDNTTVVEMDPGSFLTFDLGYYRGLLKRRGLFQSDAALITDAAALADVESVASGPLEVFFQLFARSMMRLGMVDVKTGGEGEIRRHCAVVNG